MPWPRLFGHCFLSTASIVFVYRCYGDGRVIGVNSMIIQGAEGLGFAIAIQDLWKAFSLDLTE